MTTRLLFLLLPTVGCHPWFLEQPSPADAGPSQLDAGDATTPEPATAPAPPESTSSPDGAPSGALPPLADPDAGQGGATPVVGMVPLDQQARTVAAVVAEPGWGAGVDAGSSPAVESQLPAARPLEGALALARALSSAPGPKGCGEPPLCFLRVAISTSTGRLYTARLSSTYPADACGRDVVNDGKDVLIGDSHGRFGNLQCSPTTPQIAVGFLIPNEVFGSEIERQWSAGDGFRSQWTIIHGAAADTGLYLPAPGARSTMDMLWFGRFSKGEAYGTLVVPLRNQTTGAPALGELLFDVRIR
jgi:hypothetical protein